MFRILGIGDNVVDRYLYKNKMYPGGNSVNVPVLAARTGKAKAGYIGRLGTDYAGKHVLKSLQQENVDVSHVKVVEGPNAYSNVTLVDSDRTFIGGSAGVSIGIVLDDEDLSFAKTWDLIHTSVYSKIEDLLPTLHELGPQISYDYSDHLSLEEAAPSLPYVDMAIFSGGDRPLNELKELAAAAAQKGPSTVLITMGSRGSMLYREGKFYTQGIYKIENIVDTMGAGDSFIARYLTGIFNGEETQQSMENAAEFAAKNCLLPGTFGYETDIR